MKNQEALKQFDTSYKFGFVTDIESDRPKKGLNENYARELMELHTLGVDGGYSQDDVVEVARAFTGWTTIGRKARLQKPDAKREMAQQAMGIRQEGDFRFAAAIHDADPKTVLGQQFPAGGGIEDAGGTVSLTDASFAKWLAVND